MLKDNASIAGSGLDIRTVPKRRPNSELRSREHLTANEVDCLDRDSEGQSLGTP